MTINYGRLPLFQSMDRLDRSRLIPRFTVQSFDEGRAVFRQGERGDSFYVVASGSVLVLKRKNGEETHLNTLVTGDFFGEMALLTGDPRSADVVAGPGGAVVLRLSKERFNTLIKKHNDLALKLAAILADRANDKPSPRTVLEAEGCPAPLEEGVGGANLGPLGDWLPNFDLRDRRILATVLPLLAMGGIYFALAGGSMSGQQLSLFLLLAGATVVWGLEAFSYHAVALALPLLAVLVRAAEPKAAFAGFSQPSWFLVLGVFSISAAVSRTGLMYRLLLVVMRRLPSGYRMQSLALALTGFLLTPVIPSSNGRAALAGPLVSNLSEILRFRRGSAGSVGMAMAALTGFGHMSFAFMNGTATCLLAYGLLDPASAAKVTWTSWALAALPLSLVFFAVSMVLNVAVYRPKVLRKPNAAVIGAQLRALGPWDGNERITVLIVLASLAAFMTQPLHKVDASMIALASFFILYSLGVLSERTVRSDIDWSFLLSFGALVGFGGLISSSGLGTLIAREVAPAIALFGANPYLFLFSVAALMLLVRCVLPVPAALLVILLSVLPLARASGIDPFVICLVCLLSTNPWFLSFQNTVYLNLVEATEGGLFHHRQTRRAALVYVAAVMASIAASIPYWQWMGLITK